MKFEIDDKTKTIIRMVINLDLYPEALEGWETATSQNLETISQALKKAKERIVDTKHSMEKEIGN